MPSVNLQILVGHLGRDPEVKFLPSGKSITTFSLATTNWWKKDGEWNSKSTWHNVKHWGDGGERFAKDAAKGDLVLVMGSTEQETWESEGIKKYKTIINSNMSKFLAPAGLKKIMEEIEEGSKIGREPGADDTQEPLFPTGDGGGGVQIPDDDIPF